MARTEVLRTYFEMKTPDQHRRAGPPFEGLRLEEVPNCPGSFYRYLYSAVGGPFHWVDRAHWTDDEAREHLSKASIRIWVLYHQGAPAGYFELQNHEDRSVELSYFGLLPEFHGRGLGKYLLSLAIEKAWEQNPTRLWLHTCSLDHPSAIPNYRARGFQSYNHELYYVDLND